MNAPISNAEIAGKLLALAHLLVTRKENPFKVKAYRRAAKTVQAMGESLSELVDARADLTQFAGIGSAIGRVIREIVETGTTRQIQAMESEISPELAGILRYPQLDPKRVLRLYKKFHISTVEELKAALESGEILRALGPRIDQHVRRGLSDHPEILLYESDRVVPIIQEFL